MWHKISIKKQQSPLATSSASKHYERVIPLKQQNVRHRGSSKETRSRGKSQTERKRNKSPRESSFAEGIEMVESEELVFHKRVDPVKQPQQNKFQIEYGEMLPVIKVTKEEDLTISKISKIERFQTQNQNIFVVEELKQKINGLKTELKKERQKNRETIEALQLKLRKVIQVNILYANKLSQLGTKVIVMKSIINDELIRYFQQTSLIFSKVVEEVYYQLSKNISNPLAKINRECAFPIREQPQESHSQVVLQPQQKLIRIIENVKKARQAISVPKKGKLEGNRPVVMEFIQDLRNYDQRKNRNQSQK